MMPSLMRWGGGRIAKVVPVLALIALLCVVLYNHESSHADVRQTADWVNSVVQKAYNNIHNSNADTSSNAEDSISNAETSSNVEDITQDADINVNNGIPNFNYIPTYDANRPPVKCQARGDDSSACVYQTLCFDGGTYFAVVANSDDGIENNLRGYPKFHMGQGSDCTWSRHEQEDTRLDNMMGIDKKMVPLGHNMLIESRSVDFLRRQVENKDTSVGWLPDNSLFLQPSVDNAFLSLISVLPWWNLLSDLKNGIPAMSLSGSVFVETNRICESNYFNFWKETIAEIGKSYFYNHNVNAVKEGLGIKSATSDVANGTETNSTLKTADGKDNVIENERFDGYLLDRDSIWDHPQPTKDTSSCRFKRDLHFKKIICSRNGVALGKSYTPVTGSISKQRLRYEVYTMHKEKVTNMQAAIKGTVHVLVYDRLVKHGRNWYDPKDFVEQIKKSADDIDTDVEVEFVPLLSELSVYEQFEKFSRAHVVVGVHGAGLTNTYFMNTNSALIEVIPVGWNSRSFRELYSSGGGYYQSLDAVPGVELTDQSLYKAYHLPECQEDEQSWLKSHYYQPHGNCYQMFKYHPIIVDPVELKQTLQRAYRHLKLE
ncbi:hypothetical protein SARC_10025 [Sphaeroforma arctica JP610]|uniref:Glycosyltransferase 61 catalytic domain-containing protein n=1 Tax=Sphaeroforma arctica JP610 TaxID=667725 RepID=A0A0L0FL46_9EUKA|nr:hypothetical protein SARC_10025 [Sphaeroforma arctica JP610]KNC77512.1 hypothetical protein SARC_10025 [Sphaeroforma arctica JP610]|eukprot:XP_014151414.1 hypothetical protein SARC_10025 [Sphaeroforma arctica JP610]